MTTPFIQGLIKVAIYYAIGFFLSWLLNQLAGSYIHSPGLDLLGDVVILIGGAIWLIVGLIKLFLNNHDKMNLGFLTMNIIVICSVITYVSIQRSKETFTGISTEVSGNKKDIITIYKDSSSLKNLIVNGVGDTLFSKQGDTILIDKISKDTFNYR